MQGERFRNNRISKHHIEIRKNPLPRGKHKLEKNNWKCFKSKLLKSLLYQFIRQIEDPYYSTSVDTGSLNECVFVTGEGGNLSDHQGSCKVHFTRVFVAHNTTSESIL